MNKILPVLVCWSACLAGDVAGHALFGRPMPTLNADVRLGLQAPAAALATDETPRSWFNRYCTHFGKLDDGFLDYLVEVKPQVVQAGFFGPGYYSARAIALAKGEPEFWSGFGGGFVDLGWWRRFLRRAHAHGLRVQGMCSISLTDGDHEAGLGFFDYFDNRWDTELLGPRPPGKAIDLMQRDVNGEPITDPGGGPPGHRLYFGCPANPHWRTVMKAFVKVGIDLGLDGFAVILAHRRECACPYCQRAFRRFLGDRYTATALRERFGIADLQNHTFQTINGFYMPDEAGPLSLECLKFGQLMLYECEREVFIEYGRSLKPDLLLGQWNHLYCWFCSPWNDTFSQLNGDERCTLPDDLWARGEDWVMYSIGNSGGYWRPDEGAFAQFSLEHKYLREAGRGRPHAVKVDDGTRVRAYFGEAVAHGGFAYARGPGYRDPATRRIVKTYFDFLHRHEDLYHPIEGYAEVAVVFPRRSVHGGDTAPVAAFKRAGLWLSRNHFLFDVMLDSNLNAERLARYRVLVLPEKAVLAPDQQSVLRAWQRAGGHLHHVPLADADLRVSDLGARGEASFSTITAPGSLLWTAWHQHDPRRLILHFVNYQRDLQAAKKRQGADAECPAPETDIAVRLILPDGATVRRVTLLSPDTTNAANATPFSQERETLTFNVDRVVAYTVGVVELDR